YPGDPPVQSQQGRLNLARKRSIQTVCPHADPPLMPGLPWENAIIYIRRQSFLTTLLIFREKRRNLFQMCLGDADDDMPPCPQVNLDSQLFEGFLLQNLGQFRTRPTLVGRFIGTKDISTIQSFIFIVLLLDDEFGESGGPGGPDGSGGSLFDSSSTGLLGYATRTTFLPDHDHAADGLLRRRPRRYSIAKQHLGEWTDVHEIEKDKDGD